MSQETNISKFGVLGELQCRLGLGLLRLATEGRPLESDAIALIHLALDQGIRILDTADVYALNDKELHYCERLARQAVKTWQGPGDEIRILTKVGLARPKGKWVPAGSPRHLNKVIDGCLQALEVDRLFMVQLHAKDPRVPFEETLAALAALQQSGKIEHLGLCNVSPSDVRQALRHFPVACIQNELSVLTRTSALEGMLEMTRQMGIPFLAHRPLGGYAKVEKVDKNRVLGSIAAKRDASPREIALAAVLDSAEHVIPLIGATRPESIQSSIQTLNLSLTDEDRSALAAKYSFAASPDAIEAIAPRVLPPDLPQLEPNLGPSDASEVVLLMGIQGAGKSALVESYVAHGYARLNRDTLGGKLDDLVPALTQLVSQGHRRIVLDNTYPTRVSRAPIITAAHRFVLPVRCRHVATPIHEARMNVAMRMLDRYDRLLGPDDIKSLSKSDPNLPPPVALQRWVDSFEKPELDEGFSAIDEIPFARRRDSSWTNKGLLLDVDGTIRKTVSGEIYPRTPDDIELLPNRREVLSRWIDDDYLLFFVSNQSGVASGKLDQEAVKACFDRTVELLDLPIAEICFCPHPAFPVGCFCRKPMPGQAAYLMRKYQLSQEHLVMVGDMDSDEAFATSMGVRYFDANDFFA